MITHNMQIRNYPIQSLSGELVQVSVILAWHLLKALGMQSFLVNTVHDSCIAEIHPDETGQYEEMTDWAALTGVNNFYLDLFGWNFIVPIESEFTLTTHWGDKPNWLEKIKE